MFVEPAQYLHEELTRSVIAGGIEVHRTLGPGLLESAYSRALEFELGARGLATQREQPIPVSYKGVDLGAPFRADLIVGGRVLIEVKCVETILPVHQAQTLTYMRLAKLPVGLLLNFRGTTLKEGIRRFFLSQCEPG